MRILRWFVMASLVLAACGDDDDTAPGNDSPPADSAGADGGGNDSNGGQWRTLVTADWNMPVGQEGYWCAVITTTEDMFINGYRPIAPDGTHHTALTIYTGSESDGVFPCDAGTIGFQILFGSGLGTTEFDLPEGIAYRLDAGSKVLLNLHLYNTHDNDITGTSGIEVHLLDPAAVVHEAETMYAATFSLDIPPGHVTQSASCTLSADQTVFGLFPHMHKTGSHMVGTVHQAAGGDLVIHDQDYTFESQLNYLVDPVLELKANDVVQVDCTYDNPGPDTKHFGDSSDDEMCILGLYRYPRLGGIPLCTN